MHDAITVTSGIDWSAPSYEEVRRRHRWAIPDRLNIAHIACDRHADGRGQLAMTCVDEDGRLSRHTFDDLAGGSGRLASVLAAFGVTRGDRVAVYLPQRVETALAHLAAFKLAAVTVPLSPLFRAEALRYRLHHSGAKVLVTDAEHLGYAREALDGTNIRVLSCDDPAPGAEPFWPLVREAAPSPCAETHADDPAMLVYTSGTSGMPKGALHAHRFLPGRLSGFELAHRLQARPSAGRPFYTPADWAWVGGLVDCVLTPWVFGCPVLGARRRRFDPEAFVSLLAEHHVRSLFLAPTAAQRLRAALDPDRVARAVSIESVHTAGEPLSPDAFTWCARAFGTVHELYGMTEMGATIGNCPFFDVRPGSMGKPYPGHEVALLAGDGTVVQGEGTGQIAVRRGDPGMFLRYLHDDDATRARFSLDGEWLLTGDMAHRDAAGYFHYRGRSDDMFNTAGYRVGPTEIERSIASHPAVEHAAVVGEPDQERGAIVKAFVVLRPGIAPTPELAGDIGRHVKDRLATYEYPRRIVFARELPMTPSGKIRRVELRAPGADARYGLTVQP
jgi:acetyl-CoA synthetase